MAHLGANAAWHMGQWDEMATYVSAIESEEGPELSTGSFLSAVLNVRHGNYQAAKSEYHAARHDGMQGALRQGRELHQQNLFSKQWRISGYPLLFIALHQQL